MVTEAPSPTMELPRVHPHAELQWLERASDFVSSYHLDRAMFEAAARNPQRVEPDSSGVNHGYPVTVCHRGDVVVAVGFRDARRPVVLYVWIELPMRDSGRPGTPGSSPSAPTSVKGLLSYCQRRGCRLERSHNTGHVKVYRGDVYVGTVGTTVHARTITNNFQHIRKRLDIIDAAQAQAETV